MPKETWPGVPPKEAIDFFTKKKLKPSFDYRDVWKEEHAHAFTVAKAVKVDILSDIQTGLQKALAEGKTFKQFQKELTPLLQKKGWWGVREMIDPETGDLKQVQLGSARRLKTIYDANLRSALAAGKWDRAQRTKAALPYFVYELGPSAEHREEHLKWAGTILPVDHAFWKTHFTPNGYGCKCWIRQITKRERERLLSTGDYNEVVPPVEMKEWENKRTGEVEQVPKGIDPGWQTNPGYLRQVTADKVLVNKASVLDRINPDDLMIDPVHGAAFKDWIFAASLSKSKSDNDMRTAGVMQSAEIDYLDDTFRSPADTLLLMPSAIIQGLIGKKNLVGVEDLEDLPSHIRTADIVLAQTKRSVGDPPDLIYLKQVAGGQAVGTGEPLNTYIKTTVAVDLSIDGQRINRIYEVKQVGSAHVESLLNSPDFEKVR